MRRITALLVLVLSLVLATSAQEPARPQGEPQPPEAQAQQPPADAAPAQPVFRAGINFVRVDVIVSDRDGNPVLDLKPEEFSISEDGKPQKVETFSVVKIDHASQIDAPTFEQLLKRLEPYQKVVLLSGDVHNSASTAMSY